MLSELGVERGGAFVCGRFGVRGVVGRFLCLPVELLRETVDLGSAFGDLIGRGACVALCRLKLNLKLGDPLPGTLHVVGRCRLCLFEFGLKLFGTAAVLGGFGGGDIDERLQVG